MTTTTKPLVHKQYLAGYMENFLGIILLQVNCQSFLISFSHYPHQIHKKSPTGFKSKYTLNPSTYLQFLCFCVDRIFKIATHYSE